MIKVILNAVWKFLCLKIIGKMNWEFLFGTRYWLLTDADVAKIRKFLAAEHFIILTRRRAHLTTWLLSIVEWILRRKKAYWSHSAMNLENAVKSDLDFRLVEATGDGVNVVPFWRLFDCDGVLLLRPKGVTADEWERMLWSAASNLGKRYDSLFDFADNSSLSCTELVLRALRTLPDYARRFAALEDVVTKTGRLSPQMLADCPEFEHVLEIRH